MQKILQKTLTIGLSGLLALGVVTTDAVAQRAPSVLHEMVPHIVLPETIQYNKTAKNMPGMGYSGITSPYVATYVAYPSYQVPTTAVFRPVGQVVYPISLPLLPAVLRKEEPESDPAAEEEALASNELEAGDSVLTQKVVEPIRLAAAAEAFIPILPQPESAVMQTGVFCQHPASPPSAWSFSSPLFKVASVPAGWGGQQTGSIVQNGLKGCSQNVGFMPVNGNPGEAGNTCPGCPGMVPQGVPYSTFQMGRNIGQSSGVQTQILPNGMVLLMLPPDHSNCGILRCRTGNAPRQMLLPPGLPVTQPGMMPQGMPMPATTAQGGTQGIMMLPQAGMIPGGFGAPLGTPYMPVAQQQMMPPQMQIVPVTVMTPLGPTTVYQQVPAMNPMTASPMPQMLAAQMAIPNPMFAAQGGANTMTEEGSEETLQQPAAVGAQNPMALVATPYGYAIQVPTDALQADAATQLAQMQQALLQSQMQMQQMQMMNAGLYTTPFGYAANPMPMMNVGYHPMGVAAPGQGGMSVSDMLQILTFLNNNQQKRRAGLFERIAERRETRKTANGNDPFAMLMQAWTTPYTSPDMTLRMPASNAYPYGYFGVQALPMSTANYGGYNNLYYGSTTYPGIY